VLQAAAMGCPLLVGPVGDGQVTLPSFKHIHGSQEDEKAGPIEQRGHQVEIGLGDHFVVRQTRRGVGDLHVEAGSAIARH
jgi:hypothetical protein